MALVLANAGAAGPQPQARSRAGVQEVARWLGDTPAVTRGSYIDPRLISRYETEGQRPRSPRCPPRSRRPWKRRLQSPRGWPPATILMTWTRRQTTS